MRKTRKIIWIGFLIVPMLAVITVFSCNKKSKSYTFETAVVKKGFIINTITATGTVQADTTVAIGTQVSGVIKKIYVDFNSYVKKGELLAEIDKIPLQSQVQQAQASLDDAKSEVGFQTATYERYKALLEKKLVAQADFDQVKYNYDKALANLKTSQAGYDKSIVNLNYASIHSPINGIILNRAVDQGQTVAASFNTPNLFTIGNDLSIMQVQANVDEADIGQIKISQPVDFTVDAFPNETFTGTVRQIRLQPIVTSNVVTYTVIVNAPNPGKKLMPGMTANITVLVQKIDSVDVIPAKALRFTPDAAWLAEYSKNNPQELRLGDSGSAGGQSGQGFGGQAGAGSRGQTRQGDITQKGPDSRSQGSTDPANRTQGNNQGSNQSGGNSNFQSQGSAGQGMPGSDFQTGGPQRKKPVVVWKKTGDKIQRVHLSTGAVDGTNAEVKSGLQEGDEIILSMTAQGKNSTQSQTRSPFMPQRPGGR